MGGYHHCYFLFLFFILIYFLLRHFFCRYWSFLLLLYIHFFSCVIVGIELIHLVFLQLDVFFTWHKCLPCEKARATYVKSSIFKYYISASVFVVTNYVNLQHSSFLNLTFFFPLSIMLIVGDLIMKILYSEDYHVVKIWKDNWHALIALFIAFPFLDLQAIFGYAMLQNQHHLWLLMLMKNCFD